ncbi:MAG TPA: HAD family hydrolase [Candidatus Atribacteria bacterium]|nr:HAD family hydrolase [Candidatus Atribacteria bacterium]
MEHKLKIISFDVDGTLVDSGYNDLIWFKEIPELVAKKKKINFEQSVKYVTDEYTKLGEYNLNWYDISYWITYFGIKVSPEKILEKYESKINIFPEVIPLLEKLRNKFILVITTAMPREFLKPKIKKLEKYFKFSFSALSDFKKLKNAEIYSKISKILNLCPEQILHIGDHWEFDYLAARKAGMNVIYLDRSKTKKGKLIIHNLGEVTKIIDNINQ